MAIQVTDKMVEVARQVPLHQILLDCGIELRHDANTTQQFRCPLHGDGKDQKGAGSARYYPDSNGCKCWGCDKFRDSIQWWSDYHHVGFNNAVIDICREYADIELRESRVDKGEIEGKAILEQLEVEAKRYYPRMDLKRRIALSQTFDKMWQVGCSPDSQQKVEDFLRKCS